LHKNRNKAKVVKKRGQYHTMLFYNKPVLTVEEMCCESPLVLQMEEVQAHHNGSASLCSFSQLIVTSSYSTWTKSQVSVMQKLLDLEPHLQKKILGHT